MKTKNPLPFLELFTLGLTVWTGFIIVALYTLRFSHLMLHHQDLVLLIFGPGAILLVSFAIYELRVYRRR